MTDALIYVYQHTQHSTTCNRGFNRGVTAQYAAVSPENRLLATFKLSMLASKPMRSGMMPVIWSLQNAYGNSSKQQASVRAGTLGTRVACGYLSFLDGAAELKHEKDNQSPFTVDSYSC